MLLSFCLIFRQIQPGVAYGTVAYCRFSYAGNWKLVKSIVGTKFWRSHVCLRFQAGNSVPITGSWRLVASCFAYLSILIHLQNHGSALLRYALLVSVHKLTQVIISNTINSLRIQRDSREIGLLAIKNTTKRQLE